MLQSTGSQRLSDWTTANLICTERPHWTMALESREYAISLFTLTTPRSKDLSMGFVREPSIRSDTSYIWTLTTGRLSMSTLCVSCFRERGAHSTLSAFTGGRGHPAYGRSPTTCIGHRLRQANLFYLPSPWEESGAASAAHRGALLLGSVWKGSARVFSRKPAETYLWDVLVSLGV